MFHSPVQLLPVTPEGLPEARQIEGIIGGPLRKRAKILDWYPKEASTSTNQGDHADQTSLEYDYHCYL